MHPLENKMDIAMQFQYASRNASEVVAVISSTKPCRPDSDEDYIWLWCSELLGAQKMSRQAVSFTEPVQAFRL